MVSARAHLHDIRRAELACVAPLLPDGRLRVLEIGGGDGFLAAELHRRYGWIAAVDVPDFARSTPSLYPVVKFDGLRLPFADETFDLVFTSHVLEHVSDLPRLQAEIRRIMTGRGCAVHVLPSATWRLWTIATHYATLPRRILRRLKRGATSDRAGQRRPTLRERVLAAAIDHRHGARGATVSELWLYSRFAWCRLFQRTGFQVRAVRSLGLYYTGYSLLGARLSMGRRQRLAGLLGSASVAYLLAPDPES